MKSVSNLLFICLMLVSCGRTKLSQGTITLDSIKSVQSTQVVFTPSPSPTAPSITCTTVDTPSTTPVKTKTPSPKPTLTPTKVLDVLNALINSNYWSEMGLSQEKMSKWQGYANEEIDLDETDQAELKNLLSQWKRLNQLADHTYIPSGSKLDYKVKEFQNDKGEKKLILFTVDEESTNGESAIDLFLITRSSSGEEISLWLAPKIEGLNQQISLDGKMVEYLDLKGNLMLVADAVKLNKDVKNEAALIDSLTDVYEGSRNNIHSTYPRFRFTFPSVDVDFYAIENLTYNQILLLSTALELYESKGIQSLAPFIFTGGKGYIIDIRMDERFSGMARSSAGIAWLDPEKIVGNRYYLAEVIAHEGAHLRQDPTYECNTALKYEIGKGVIPPELYGWSGAELMQALADLEVGAYHVSIWVLSKLGIEIPEMLKWIIQEGRYNRSMILVNCP